MFVILKPVPIVTTVVFCLDPSVHIATFVRKGGKEVTPE